MCCCWQGRKITHYIPPADISARMMTDNWDEKGVGLVFFSLSLTSFCYHVHPVLRLCRSDTFVLRWPHIMMMMLTGRLTMVRTMVKCFTPPPPFTGQAIKFCLICFIARFNAFNYPVRFVAAPHMLRVGWVLLLRTTLHTVRTD